jgi:hypothetical protein
MTDMDPIDAERLEVGPVIGKLEHVGGELRQSPHLHGVGDRDGDHGRGHRGHDSGGDVGGDFRSSLVRGLVHGWSMNGETRMTMRVPRHRYRDSNPGFRTENPAS